MKRIVIALFFSVLLLLCTVSCKQTKDYTPSFTLAEGYTLNGDLISATVIGEGSLRIRDFLICSDAVTVFNGSSSDQYVQGLDAQIPLTFGKNKMVIRFSDGTHEKEYDFEITCISIQSFRILVNNPDKTYHVGESFDKSTITVLAVKEDGTEFEVKQYTPEYEFFSIGKHSVGIELDGCYESFFVNVTEEYHPILDEGNSADGVFYRISNGSAILLDAKSKEGFFAVPAAVTVNGQEYPVTEIADNAFSSSWITGILIPETVRRIGNDAFSECLALEWIEMPLEMDSIGPGAFYNCEALLSFDIPDGVTELKPETFRNCKALSYISLPSTLEIISDRAFKDCASLSDVRLPKNLRVIGSEAFHSCKNLSTVIVENLNELGNSAFAYCTELTYFCIGNVETAGVNLFTDNKKLTVYAPRSGVILQRATDDGIKAIAVDENTHCVVSLPIEFPIEEDYPYDETIIVKLSQGKLHALSDYTVEYPEDACGYLEATIREGDFSHTFTVFISYTEEIALDRDSRGVIYSLDSVSGKAILVQAPEWLLPSAIYSPKADGLFIVPTTLWREDKMYVVVFIEENAFEQTKNVETVFVPVLTQDA